MDATGVKDAGVACMESAMTCCDGSGRGGAQIIGYVIPGELKKALENLQKNRRQEVAARLSLVSRSAGTAGSADSNVKPPADPS